MHGHHKSAIPAHQGPISHAPNASYSVKPLVSPVPIAHPPSIVFVPLFFTPPPRPLHPNFFDISDPEKSFMQMTGHYTDIDIPRCCRAKSRFLRQNPLYLSFIARISPFSFSFFPFLIFISLSASRLTSSTVHRVSVYDVYMYRSEKERVLSRIISFTTFCEIDGTNGKKEDTRVYFEDLLECSEARFPQFPADFPRQFRI